MKYFWIVIGLLAFYVPVIGYLLPFLFSHKSYEMPLLGLVVLVVVVLAPIGYVLQWQQRKYIERQSKAFDDVTHSMFADVKKDTK